MGIDLDEIFLTATCPVTLTLTFSVQGHLIILVTPLRLSLLSFILMITDIILCMIIDLDQISSTATCLCDPDLDFSCSRSLHIFTVYYM